MTPRRHAPGCPPDCDVCLADYLDDEEAAATENERECPRCTRPIYEHWHVAMDRDEMEAWLANELVCTLTQGDVRLLIIELDTTEREV